MNDIFMGSSMEVMGILSMLACLVSVIVQVLKDIPVFKKLPTKAMVIVVSFVVTIVMMFVYTSYAHIAVLWYYIVLAIFASFMVAYIAMYGWETLKELKDRYTKR